MREVTRLRDEDIGAATLHLRRLSEQTEAALKTLVSSWHSRQCLSLLATLENEKGNLETAARIDEEIADQAAKDLRELQHASAYHFAVSALSRFTMGENEKGLILSEKAFALMQPYVDPSETYEKLVREVRRVRQKQSGDGASHGG
ncbi:MAG TPA: hypothetical protein VHP35_00460 [Terriglobia bacterium]|jgi:hypothetical protein|nr:hypothetical protein [Terriglobia bacterium]